MPAFIGCSGGALVPNIGYAAQMINTQGLETLWRGGCGVGAVESPIVVLEGKPLFMAGWAA